MITTVIQSKSIKPGINMPNLKEPQRLLPGRKFSLMISISLGICIKKNLLNLSEDELR